MERVSKLSQSRVRDRPHQYKLGHERMNYKRSLASSSMAERNASPRTSNTIGAEKERARYNTT